MRANERFEQTASANHSTGDSLTPVWDRNANASLLERAASNGIPSAFPRVDLYDSRTLVADNTTPDAARMLKGGISTVSEAQTESEKYADTKGVVPFGAVQLNASDSRTAAQGYLVVGLPIRGDKGHKEFIEVNIPDSMKVNGHPVTDEGMHRGTFPIAHRPGQQANWNWIDATIQRTGNNMTLIVHGVSPSETKPSTPQQWDQLNWACGLRYQRTPQRIDAQQFWQDAPTGRTHDQSIMTSNLSRIVSVKETAKPAQ